MFSIFQFINLIARRKKNWYRTNFVGWSKITKGV